MFSLLLRVLCDSLWLEVAAAFHGAGHGDFVGVLDVGAGGDSGGDAGEAEGGGDAADLVGEVGGGGFAFGGGRGGEDDFFDGAVGVGEAGEEVGDAELLRTYSADGRERAVEDVVDAVVAAGLFDGGDVGGLFEDAERALVADGAGAVGAGVDVGDVVAEGAEAELGAEFEDGFGEGAGVFVGGAEDVEGEALRGFGADAGELAQLVDEAGHGFGETGHFSRLLQAGEVEAAHHACDG